MGLTELLTKTMLLFAMTLTTIAGAGRAQVEPATADAPFRFGSRRPTAIERRASKGTLTPASRGESPTFGYELKASTRTGR